jgi:hypothetical protein
MHITEDSLRRLPELVNLRFQTHLFVDRCRVVYVNLAFVRQRVERVYFVFTIVLEHAED